MSLNLVREIDDTVRFRHALVSVADKRGLEVLAPRLLAAAPELVVYSTGATAERLGALVPQGLRHRIAQVSSYTGQPEMQGGLVKTLDFRIYLGLLSETYNDAHRRDLERTRSVAIDLVVCNLYPFAQAVSAADATPETARGNIDIGGPCMVRAAAKNYLRVVVVTEPSDYAALLEEIERLGGAVSFETRFRLARKAFRHTADYESRIASYLEGVSFEDVRRIYHVHGGSV